jgi:cell division protein FtsI/penicillin-binding protein 2
MPLLPARVIERARIWYGLVLLVLAIFLVRTFYLQVIRYDYYHHAALSDQLKQYEIPAKRGLIQAHQGSTIVPVVLNQRLYTLYVDPTLVKDASRVSETLALNLGGKPQDYQKKLKTQNTRYVVLAKKVPEDKKQAILTKKYPGIGAQEQDYRAYPNGPLASQLLGFVNDNSKGIYGVEQALNAQLSGRPGQLKAVTDINGIPLAASTGNTLQQPRPGKNVVLTVDTGMQKQLEDILQEGLKNAKSDSGSALIMDPRTGAIKAMANYPTYDPNNYSQVEDAKLFNNAAVSDPLEIGSTMKPLTMAAALSQGVVKSDTSYSDPARWEVNGYKITNVEEDGGPGVKNMAQLLNLSLNTGATWLLMQMSQPGGTTINQKGHEVWHDYMVNHYRFGQLTGVEQGYESEGYVPDTDESDVTYANTSFGQGMTATPLQMGAALSAVINGGNYYRPHLVEQMVDSDGRVSVKQPELVQKNVVSPQVSQNMQSLMEYVVKGHGLKFNSMYNVGGKTGTAQIAKPGGAGYYEHEFNGTYMGFVGGDNPEYVIVVRANKPHIGGYAGSVAAQPIFANLTNMLINNFSVTPKTH